MKTRILILVAGLGGLELSTLQLCLKCSNPWLSPYGQKPG